MNPGVDESLLPLVFTKAFYDSQLKRLRVSEHRQIAVLEHREIGQ